jgi:predicted sulfurtransferase
VDVQRAEFQVRKSFGLLQTIQGFKNVYQLEGGMPINYAKQIQEEGLESNPSEKLVFDNRLGERSTDDSFTNVENRVTIMHCAIDGVIYYSSNATNAMENCCQRRIQQLPWNKLNAVPKRSG